MKIREMISRFSAILFYAALPLLVPALYAYYLGEAILFPMLFVIGLMIAPSLFFLLPGFLSQQFDALKSLIALFIKKEIPWNYPEILKLEKADFHNMKLGDLLALISFCWLIIPIITAYPYYTLGFSIVDSFFESMSGWTSTGLSVVDFPEQLPKSFIFYRSMTQWIGGLGFITFMLLVFRSREASYFLRMEGKEPIELGVIKSARAYWSIYIILTLVAVIFLYLSGFDLFNAVNLAMAGLANGGWFPFSVYPFTQLQKFIMAFIMLLGATSFLLHKRVLSGDFRALLREEFLFYIFVIASSILLIYFVTNDELLNTSFNAISGFASGGFAIGDLTIMHEFSKYVIILLMVSGGMSCSTTGGIKIWRIMVAINAVFARIKSSFLPAGTVQRIKMDNLQFDDAALIEVLTFIFLYLFIFLFSSGVFMALGQDIVNSMFVVASAMSNVGLSTISISLLGTETKIFLSFLMYIGRIEILPLLAMIKFIIHRS